MELRENILLIICVVVPTIYCGKLSEFLAAQYFVHLYSQPAPKTDMWINRNLAMNDNDLFHNTSNEFLTKSWTPADRTTLLRWLGYAVITHDQYSDIMSTSPYKRKPMPYGLTLPAVEKRQYRKHTDTNIELLVVIDYSIYQKFMKDNFGDVSEAKRKIEQYFSILIATVSERFETISDASFSVHVQICDIFIAESRRALIWFDSMSRWSLPRENSVVNASRALRRFKKWLRRNKSLPHYDHAILFTSYLLRNITKKGLRQVDGLAYVGTMCDTTTGKSASIVHDDGDFRSVGVIAHELGHSLGATHDGEGNNIICPADKNYIMAPQISHEQTVAKNVFYFSKCSVKQLKSFILSDKARCLLNTPKRTISHSLSKTPPGKIFDENDQCQMAFGETSMFCELGAPRSSICSRLWCTSQDPKKCESNNRLMALPGTPCGDNESRTQKHCHLGECVSVHQTTIASNFRHMLYNKIPVRDEYCPVGDFNVHYCRVIIRASPYLCDERKEIKTACCESCRNVRTTSFYLR